MTRVPFFVFLILIALPTLAYADTRGLNVLASPTVATASTSGQILAANSSHVFLASGYSYYAATLDSPFTSTLLFSEPDQDQISGGFYDVTNRTMYLCTKFFRRVYRWRENQYQKIFQLSQTTSAYWSSCAYDSVNDVLFVAGEQEIGAIPNVRSQQNSNAWFSTTLSGTVSQVRTVVVGGGRVYFGGSSGNIFVSPTSNIELQSNLITKYTRGNGQVQSLAFGSSRNRLYIGNDRGILYEIVTSTMIISRQFNVTKSTAQITSIVIDNSVDTLFIHVFDTTNSIIRFNLNEAELNPFASLPLASQLSGGLIDVRPSKNQMYFMSASGAVMNVITTTDCTLYTCDTCYFDRNYCGFCTDSFKCSTKTQCNTEFYVDQYTCPKISQLTPSSAPIEGGTTITVTGNFVDVHGDLLAGKVECRWLGSTLAQASALVISKTTLQCTTPQGLKASDVGSYFFFVYFNDVQWGETSIFSFTACDSFLDIGACITKPNCGYCISSSQCTPLSGCASGWTQTLPPLNVTPKSASITGTQTLVLFSDVALPDSIFELSYAGIPSTTTTCIRINDRNLGCPVPVVSKSDWDANRGQNNQMTVSLSLDAGLRSFSTYEGFTIYDCYTFSQECTSCSAFSECSFCFDTKQCNYKYNATCSTAGTCISITSAVPDTVYVGDLSSQIPLTLNGNFAGLQTESFSCDMNGMNGITVRSSATWISDTTATCPVPTTLLVGTYGLSLWLRGSPDARVSPDYTFNVYDCASNLVCNDCLSASRPACRYCHTSASCVHQSATCATMITTAAQCPTITSVLPSSVPALRLTDVHVVGDLRVSSVSNPKVACRWGYRSNYASTSAISFNDTNVLCSGANATGAITTDFSISVNDGSVAYSNSLPYAFYNCKAIGGDCSACLTNVTAGCKWCASGCDNNCDDSELEMTTCPSLTSIQPDHSHINGNELITITGGPFYVRLGYTYECRFGDRRALATVVNKNAIQCQSPPVTGASTVSVTVWLNGINYAPYSVLSFTYFTCATTAETVCSSSCTSQQYCGWCPSTLTCTASSLCSAIDDMFLQQCLGVTLDPPFLSVGQSQDMTVRVTPTLPKFFVLSALSSNKRTTQQIAPDQLVTCALSDGQTTSGVIKSSTEIVCPSLSVSSVATTLTVKYNNTALFAPVSVTDACSAASSCSDCINITYCGWCSSSNKCTTQSSCSDTWQSDSCSSAPGSNQVTGGADPAVVAPAVIIPVVVVGVAVALLLLWLRRRKGLQRVEDGTEMSEKKKQEVKIMNTISTIDEKLRIPSKSLALKKELGAGSFGKVYLGEWQGAKVAIKVCASVANVDGFFEEAALTVGLPPHPNVVQTFGISVDGPLPYIVLEFCEGGSLDKKLFDDGVAFTMSEKVRLIKGIARGLLHLHNHNIVHRDLAARNILLTSNNEPKISDFGMSRLLKEESQKGQTKNNFGPIRWMAPESIRDLSYSTKSDVWSFGVIMYEIVSGMEPHSDVTDIIEIAMKIKTENYHPQLSADIDPKLSSLMLACWRPAAADRPSMNDVVQTLASAFVE